MNASGPTGAHGPPPRCRTAFAAAHVVSDPLADAASKGPAVIDWDATLAFRHHLWAHGLGVAEAMDTAQRGMGLDWPAAAELIRRSAAEARAVGGALVCGAGTDQLPSCAHAPTGDRSAKLAAVRGAYEEQLALVESVGARPVVMASRALAATARGPEDYEEVYGHLLRQAAAPVILHWLGPMFDPALQGYWGSDDLDAATGTFLRIIADHPDKVDGVKVSLLDAEREIRLRRRLRTLGAPPRPTERPERADRSERSDRSDRSERSERSEKPDRAERSERADRADEGGAERREGVRCYTGDDLNYPRLIEGDEHGFSHALLGVFDPLAAPAAEALRLLDIGDRAGFRRIMDPTVALARHLFQAPTRHYKTGVVFLAWLAGHQPHFTMVGGLESARSLAHLRRAHELADRLGLFPDPELASFRMRELTDVHGDRA